MGTIRLTGNVREGNNFAEFRAAIDAAGEPMMREIAEEGAKLSRQFAPRGIKQDPRTGHLSDNIEPSSGGGSARWTARVRHALAIEFGASPHLITGWVNFYWANAGRDWEPGANMINHPGNAAHPYLRPAFEIMMSRALEIARKYYP